MSTYESITTTSPVYSGPYLLDFPFSNRGDIVSFVASKEYFIRAESYVPPTLNSTITITPTGGSLTTLYCVGDYNQSRSETGGMTFTRKWANVPASLTTPTELSYTFPALLETRGAFTVSAQAITLDEYFLVGTGGSYASFDAIPSVRETSVTFGVAGPYPMSAGNFFLNNGGAGVDASTPTLSTYVGYITTDRTTEASYTLVAKASTLTQYYGNIWKRTTTKCKAL